MIIKFIDRHQEISYLSNLAAGKRSALVLLYGRRRVGKTRLIEEFLKSKKSLYFYVPNGEEKTILTELSSVVENEFFPGFQFSDFKSFLEYLKKTSMEGTIIAIDEFQRLTSVDGAMSLLQKYWDDQFSKNRCFLILSGSSMGAMRKVALSGDAPLYGRRTATLKIEPLRYLDLLNWFDRYSVEELVKIYGSFGGTPAYLEQVDERLPADENIIQKILSKNAPLNDEPEMLLMEEIRTPQRYMDILTAVASGQNKLTEISEATGLNRESTNVYLNALEILDLIERISPVDNSYTKRGLYHIKDQFFNFWFRFVRPNKREIELELERNVWQGIMEDFNCYLGHVFEDVCNEVLIELAKKSALPIPVEKVGKWWWKETEIDLLGLQRKSGKVLAVEVKWSDISYREAKTLILELEMKTKQVQFAKKAVVGVMAKKIDEKESLRNEGFFALDLQDIQKMGSNPRNK